MTTYSELRHNVDNGHIVAHVPLTWRLYLLWVSIKDNPVPLWLAIAFIAFCLFAAKSVMGAEYQIVSASNGKIHAFRIQERQNEKAPWTFVTNGKACPLTDEQRSMGLMPSTFNHPANFETFYEAERKLLVLRQQDGQREEDAARSALIKEADRKGLWEPFWPKVGR